jgi:MerR family transcriptional regulator, light-induced transcriptional regulator
VTALDQLASRVDAIADAIIAGTWLDARHRPQGRPPCAENARYHVIYLHQALSVDDPALFEAYAVWSRSLFEQRAIPVEDLITSLQLLGELAGREVPELAASIDRMIDQALSALRRRPSPRGSFLVDGAPHVDLGRAYLAAMLASQRSQAVEMVVDAAAGGVSLRDLYLQVFQPVQYEVGRLWQLNRINVAQEHYCTAITQLAMSQLYPYLFEHPRCRPRRRMVATCVAGDLHELGVRMVADFFEMAGWDTTFLGADTPEDSVVERVRAARADVVAISATVTTHLDGVRRVVTALRADEITRGTTVLVGGQPFNARPELCEELGADGTATDAEGAVRLATQLRERR